MIIENISNARFISVDTEFSGFLDEDWSVSNKFDTVILSVE